MASNRTSVELKRVKAHVYCSRSCASKVMQANRKLKKLSTEPPLPEWAQAILDKKGDEDV